MSKCDLKYQQLLGGIVLQRKQRCIEQACMAKEMGISQPSLSRLESGKSKISLKQFLMYCDKLEIKVTLS